MSTAEEAVKAARKARNEKSAELAQRRNYAKNTSGSEFHRSGLKKRSEYGSVKYSK